MSNPYYRINDLYFDKVGGGLYICTVAGYSLAAVTANPGLTPTSSWQQISGGSGSNVSPYIFVSDGGDYIVGTAGIATTTLTTDFTSGTPITTLTVASVTGIVAGMSVSGIGLTAGVTVVSVNTSTKVVTITSVTPTNSSSGNYTFTAPLVNIAKPPKIRCSIASETYIDGTNVHTFTYTPVVVGSTTVAYTRLNTWAGTSSETEQITPAYLVGDLVYAITIPAISMIANPTSGGSVTVALLDIHDKDWAT
ncbi:MAG: hypothetical protein ABSH48_02385 [Verrucomicrobiota bacterium]|jgi:hypothetical protein